MNPPLHKSGDQLVFAKGVSLRTLYGKRDRSVTPGITQGVVAYSHFMGESWYYALENFDKQFLFCEEDLLFNVENDSFAKVSIRKEKKKEERL